MSRSQKANEIKLFNKSPDHTVFLISLKAGGVGLNLTEAKQVLLVDPWWNPAVEQQAIDRVHRFGQTDGVHVVHFIVEDTIEARIMELQEQKKLLAKGALGETPMTRLQIRDLRMLFRSIPARELNEARWEVDRAPPANEEH